MTFEWTDTDSSSYCAHTENGLTVIASTYENGLVKGKQSYGYKINVNGVDHVCGNCFFFKPHLLHAVAEESIRKALDGVVGDDLFIK